MRHPRKARNPNQQSGFTLIELAIATVVMVVGLVAVAQLVPASMRLNSGSMRDSAALVFAQRELDQMLQQPLTATSFVDAQGFTCSLGNAATPNVVVGSPVAVINNRPAINFSGIPVAGYSFTYADPNDPSGTAYDVRWAVIATVGGTTVYSKRYILGVVRRGGNSFLPAVTLDMVVYQ